MKEDSHTAAVESILGWEPGSTVGTVKPDDTRALVARWLDKGPLPSYDIKFYVEEDEDDYYVCVEGSLLDGECDPFTFSMDPEGDYVIDCEGLSHINMYEFHFEKMKDAKAQWEALRVLPLPELKLMAARLLPKIKRPKKTVLTPVPAAAQARRYNRAKAANDFVASLSAEVRKGKAK